MRWRLVAVSTLLLAVGTACPRDWEKGGTNDQAMEKDFKAALNAPLCPEGMKRVPDESCEREGDAGTCPEVCR